MDSCGISIGSTPPTKTIRRPFGDQAIDASLVAAARGVTPGDVISIRRTPVPFWLTTASGDPESPRDERQVLAVRRPSRRTVRTATRWTGAQRAQLTASRQHSFDFRPDRICVGRMRKRTDVQLDLRHGESYPTIRPWKRCSSTRCRNRRYGNRDSQDHRRTARHSKPRAIRLFSLQDTSFAPD